MTAQLSTAHMPSRHCVGAPPLAPQLPALHMPGCCTPWLHSVHVEVGKLHAPATHEPPQVPLPQPGSQLELMSPPPTPPSPPPLLPSPTMCTAWSGHEVSPVGSAVATLPTTTLSARASTVMASGGPTNARESWTSRVSRVEPACLSKPCWMPPSVMMRRVAVAEVASKSSSTCSVR